MPEIEYINAATDIPSIQFTQQSSDIAAPSAGFWQTFFKSTGAWIRENGQSAIRLLTESDLSALTFPASARILGTFAGNHALRTLFKNSVVNNPTIVGTIPNGTNTVSGYAVYNAVDANNSTVGYFLVSGSYAVYIDIVAIGTGTVLPFAILLGSSEKFRIMPDGKVAIGTTSPTALFDINSDILRVRVAKTPSNASAAGNQGDFCWDTSYFYICTATNTWKRVALASW